MTDNSDDRRVDEARNKVERIEQEQADLDADLAADVSDVEAKWSKVAADITTTSVPAEKTDTKVTRLVLVWLPSAA